MIALLLLLPILVGVAVTLSDVSTAQNRLDTQQDKLAHAIAELHQIQHRSHREQLESCERGNDSRLATVRNYRHDRAQLKLYEEIFHRLLPPTPLQRFAVALTRESIEAKTRAIKHTIASQAEVAVAPGSPIVDCAKAYKVALTP